MKMIHCDKCDKVICPEFKLNDPRPYPHKITIDKRHHYADPYNEFNVELCEDCYKNLLEYLNIGGLE